jgi:hypothetical protein
VPYLAATGQAQTPAPAVTRTPVAAAAPAIVPPAGEAPAA